MDWITKITIDNYRAFSKPAKIIIPYGNHLLIYGENGSGKSSIYTAVEDFLRSSDSSLGVEFTSNEFSKANGNTTGVVEIEVRSTATTNSRSFVFSETGSNSADGNPDIMLANKLKGFLDYKKILKVHALDVPPDIPPNIFGLLVNDLLGYHRIGMIGTRELAVEYNCIAGILTTEKKNSIAYRLALTDLEYLNNTLITQLTKVFEVANKLLQQYFKNKLRLDINYFDLQVNEKKQMVEQISLRVYYAEKEIKNYHVFLNEARLSSLAICLYLASIKTNPQTADLRVLYLDDVFIGLDMCNRIPLLQIIYNEFMLEGYQLFFSTYDHQWFEIAKQWFSNIDNGIKFKCLELFVKCDDDPATPDLPVIIFDRGDYLEMARNHYGRKDYPAAANYLRKSCEKELKRILPENELLKTDTDKLEVSNIDMLGALITKFKEFIEKNNLDATPFLHFTTYSKIVLNPFSHDDLKMPHYRTEIESGIRLVEDLQRILCKDSGEASLTLAMPHADTNEVDHYDIELMENLRIIKQGASPIILSASECVVHWNAKDIPCKRIQKAFKQILHYKGYPKDDFNILYQSIDVSEGRKLIDLMTF